MNVVTYNDTKNGKETVNGVFIILRGNILICIKCVYLYIYIYNLNMYILDTDFTFKGIKYNNS